MRRSRLVLAAGVLVVLVPALALGALAVVVPPRLSGWVERAAERSFDADVELGDVSVSLLRSFPRASVSISSLSVKGRAPFDGVELLSLGPSRIDVDLLSALGSRLEIEGLELDHPAIHVVVLPDGRSNLDTFLGTSSSEDQGGTSTSIALRDARITGLSAVYDDRADDLRAAVDGLDATLEGLVGTPTRFDVKATAARADVTSGGTRYLDHAALAARVALEQAPDGTLTLADNEVKVNTFPLAFGGTLTPVGESTRIDLTFSSPASSLPGLLSLLPGTTTDSLAGVKTAGTVAFDGSVKGAWPGEGDALPALDLELRLADASFRFPDLPAGVDQLALDVAIHHPEGPAGATEIDARSFHLAVAGQPIEGRLSIRDPLGDPAIDTSLHGRVDLAALRSTWPALADAAPPAGRLEVDADVKGRLSDFEGAKVDAVTCTGTLKGSGIRYTAEGWPDLTVDRFALTLSPEAVDLADTSVSWKGSDSTWSGRIEDVIPWLVRGDTLRGTLSLQSRSMDLRPFQGDTSADAPPAEEEGAIAVVPTWVDLRMDASIGHLVTEEFAMDHVQGTILVKDGALRMDPLAADMLGGRVTMSGAYRAPDPTGADLELEVTAAKLQLAKTFATFETMERLAPVLKGVQSSFDSGFTMQGRLLADGSPDLATLSSKGVFVPAAAALAPAALATLGQQLHAPDAGTLRLAGSRIGWALDGGKAKLDAFDARLGGQAATVSGTVGVVDRTLDLRVTTQVPAALVAGIADQVGAGKGRAGPVDLVATIGGTWDRPKVGVTFGGASAGDLVQEVVGAAVDQALDDLVAQASQAGDALLAAARQEADRLRSEARAAAKKLNDEAAKKGEDLVDAAGGNPVKVAAAKETSKQLQKQAKSKGDALVAKADEAADRAVAEATAKKQALIDEAKKKAGQKP